MGALNPTETSVKDDDPVVNVRDVPSYVYNKLLLIYTYR